MATQALSTREELEREKAKTAKSRAKSKATKMRLVEGGGFVVAALGGGFLDSKAPIGFMDGALNWGHLFLGIGAILLVATKGMSQEFGSGLLFGGAAPVLREIGGTIAERFAT